MLYNGVMDKHVHTTVKIWTETQRILRTIAALTGKSIVATMHRLALAELRNLRPAARQAMIEMSGEDEQ